MNHQVIMLIGPPGVGKTCSLKRVVSKNYQNYQAPENGKIKWALDPPWCFAGHYGVKPTTHHPVGTFDGGDMVPKDGAQLCLDYWEENILPNPAYRATILDGERYSTSKVLARLDTYSNIDITCVLLDASEEVLNQRLSARGAGQNPTWVKGRGTLARNFASRFIPSADPVGSMFGEPPAELDRTLVSINTDRMSIDEVAHIIRSLGVPR